MKEIYVQFAFASFLKHPALQLWTISLVLMLSDERLHITEDFCKTRFLDISSKSSSTFLSISCWAPSYPPSPDSPVWSSTEPIVYQVLFL